MVGEIGCTLFVIVKRFFFAAIVGVDEAVEVDVAGDFDAEADRLVGMLFILVDAPAVAAVRLGDGGRVTSSLTVVDVKTVNEGAVDSIASDDNGEEFELLLMVRNDDDVDVVVMDDETGLLIIKRGVGFVTMGFVFVVVVVDIEFVCDGKFGGVELPDDESMSEMEFERS